MTKPQKRKLVFQGKEGSKEGEVEHHPIEKQRQRLPYCAHLRSITSIAFSSAMVTFDWSNSKQIMVTRMFSFMLNGSLISHNARLHCNASLAHHTLRFNRIIPWIKWERQRVPQVVVFLAQNSIYSTLRCIFIHISLHFALQCKNLYRCLLLKYFYMAKLHLYFAPCSISCVSLNKNLQIIHLPVKR